MCQPASGKSALSTFKSPHPNEITIWLNDSSTIDKVESLILFKYSFKVPNIYMLTWIFSLNLTCHSGIYGRVSNPNLRFLKAVSDSQSTTFP